MKIEDLLKIVSEKIKNGDDQAAMEYLNNFVAKDPGAVDDRFAAELSLISDLISSRGVLKEWEYFYSIKLVYEYCEKLYAGVSGQGNAAASDRVRDTAYENVIWWCWLQGLDKAPDIVKRCYDSLLKLDRKIIVITEENLEDYIRLPDVILQKYRQGIITRTHLSDLIRIELLSRYGGTWIDATVFCTATERILQVLDSAPLFAYSFVMRDSVSRYMLFDSWFMHVKGKSAIIEDTRKMLYAYWEKEDSLRHYFLFHIFFSIACRKNEDEFYRIPVFSNEPCHVLQLEQQRPFDRERFDQIMGMSDIHKLTYKYDTSVDISGSFLGYIMDGRVNVSL